MTIEAFQKAQEVFHPLLARRGQEEQIRMRLKIYEKYNFIFSLGGKFEKYIELVSNSILSKSAVYRAIVGWISASILWL